MKSLEFSLYINKVILSASKGNFTSSSVVCIYFSSFSCLIALARSSSTMLNRNGKGGHSCLVSELREKIFNLSPLSMF